MPPGSNSTENALLALGTLIAGAGAIAGIVLVAQGRQREVYPWAIAATITTTVVGAARLLGGQAPLARL